MPSYNDSANNNPRDYKNTTPCRRSNRATKTEYNKKQFSKDLSYLRFFSNPINFHVSLHTMILGARINTVFRKSLTIDRLMRFPGGRDSEHDSPVEGAGGKHTLFSLLKFL
jgi:hypothetical protein